jgi:hypothetical protein
MQAEKFRLRTEMGTATALESPTCAKGHRLRRNPIMAGSFRPVNCSPWPLIWVIICVSSYTSSPKARPGSLPKEGNDLGALRALAYLEECAGEYFRQGRLWSSRPTKKRGSGKTESSFRRHSLGQPVRLDVPAPSPGNLDQPGIGFRSYGVLQFLERCAENLPHPAAGRAHGQPVSR